MLDLAEAEHILWVRGASPASGGYEASARLAADLSELGRSVRERESPLACVAFACAGPSFFIPRPTSAADCDTAVDAWSEAIDAVAGIEAPTVAVLASDAVGAAWELALACDVRIASSAARFGSPEVRWGRIPAAGGTQRLVRAVGPMIAMRLLLRGEIFSATDAFGLGAVHGVASPDELEARGEALVREIAVAAPIALAYTKEAAMRSADLALADGLRIEADLASLLQTTADRAEGIDAFLSRRRPEYRGR